MDGIKAQRLLSLFAQLMIALLAMLGSTSYAKSSGKAESASQSSSKSQSSTSSSRSSGGTKAAPQKDSRPSQPQARAGTAGESKPAIKASDLSPRPQPQKSEFQKAAENAKAVSEGRQRAAEAKARADSDPHKGRLKTGPNTSIGVDGVDPPVVTIKKDTP